jgi:hypothetical protein
MTLNVDSGRPVSKDQIGAMIAAYGAYPNAMKEAGAYVGGERLHPSSTARSFASRTASRRC